MVLNNSDVKSWTIIYSLGGCNLKLPMSKVGWNLNYKLYILCGGIIYLHVYITFNFLHLTHSSKIHSWNGALVFELYIYNFRYHGGMMIGSNIWRPSWWDPTWQLPPRPTSPVARSSPRSASDGSPVGRYHRVWVLGISVMRMRRFYWFFSWIEIGEILQDR